ncbi:MAG: hypothetical protein K2X77_00040 [Candidatus Obscuribacterales bacterium]|nr:hypothetical protein [Candidatus Obscuribacterales bacterium]
MNVELTKDVYLNEYNDTDIEVLEGLEPVRRRPKLWVGSTDARGLHQLAWYLVYNCLDEFDAGYCKNISVTVNNDGSLSVEDDGRGIETDVIKKTGKTGIETMFTTLGCPTGFELAVVNGLSEKLEVEVFRDGNWYKKSYQRGKSASPQGLIGNTEQHGTRVTIWPDRDIFEEAQNSSFDFDTLLVRLRELAYLNKTLRVELTDSRNNNRESFHFYSGISDYLSWLNDAQLKVNKAPIYLSKQQELPEHQDSLKIECVIQWTDREECLSLVFFNNDNINEEFPLDDLPVDLASALNKYARANQLLNTNCDISDIELSNGISAILSIRSQSSLRWLGKEYLRSIVKNVVPECFMHYLLHNRDDTKVLIETIAKERASTKTEN